ncbi:unnamed protein product [Effrenium voratum]|nr:unnamed protein product [Effrenium voratum]
MDELLRAQDAKLRQEQQQLRQENARLQKALAEVNGLNHTAMEDLSSMLASLVQQTSHQVASAKTPPDPGADALPAGEMDVDDLYGDGPSVTMSPSKRRMTIVMMIGGAVLFVTYLVHNAYTTYKEMDGEIDDVKEFAAGVLCCGLSYSAAWSLGVVMLGAGVGFAFLWWQHMIQPFLKELACYVYLGLVVLLIIGILLADFWSRFTVMFTAHIQALERVMSFLRIDQAQDYAKGVWSSATNRIASPRG